MYFDCVIPVPRIQGRITLKKLRGTTYVYYEYDRDYKPERRYAIPRRACIGKLVREGAMQPNENLRRYLPQVVIPEEEGVAGRSSCLRCGAWLVVRKLAEECRLPEFLEHRFGSPGASLALDLACYALVTEDSAAQRYPDYAYGHPLFTEGMRIPSDPEVSDFLRSVTSDRTLGFLEEWNAVRRHDERIYVSFDAVDKRRRPGDLDLAEPVRSGDGGCRPVFGYAVAHDLATGDPLFYEEYPGGVVDAPQLACVLDRAAAYGYPDVGFVLDRGCFREGVLGLLDEGGHVFIVMVRGRRKPLRDLALRCRGTFETSRECAVGRNGVYATTVRGRLLAGDTRERPIHLYHSARLEAEEREALESDIARLGEWLDRHKGREVTPGGAMSACFELTFDGSGRRLLSARGRRAAIEEELKLCGYFGIVASESMTAAETLEIYKGIDAGERLFRGDKPYLGDTSLLACPEETVDPARIFLEFIALIIRSRLHRRLEAIDRTEVGTPAPLTVPTVVRELERIEMIREADGAYRLDHALTDTQKAILGAFGLTEDFLRKQAVRLGREPNGKDRGDAEMKKARRLHGKIS